MKQNDTNKIIVFSILAVLILSVFGIIIYKLIKEGQEDKEGNKKINPTDVPSASEEYKGFVREIADSNSCSNNTCQVNIDTDPIDNIKNVVKKTLLLEEHLTEKNNICHECIVTHFLQCIGLLEEAILIAHKNAKQYPFLEKGYKLYKELFEEWLENKQNNKQSFQSDKQNEINQNILEKLRNFRKKLVEQYYIL
jgi:hypothetical protein